MDNSKPHILILAYYFPPAPEIGGLRPLRLRKYLERLGYRCHVITAAHPIDPASPGVLSVPDKLEAIWDGRSDQERGIEGLIELAIRGLFFPGHIGFAWSVEVARQSRRLLREHPGQKFVLFTTYPSMGVLFAGLMIHLRTRIQWICDFRDPMGVDPKVSQASRWTRICNSVLERLVFKKADSIIANTEAAANRMVARHPWARSKTHVIWNGFDPEDQPQARELPARAEKIIIHAGALYLGRNPDLVLRSLSRLRKQGVAEACSACILLVGRVDHHAGIDPVLTADAERDGWLRVMPVVSKAEALRLNEEADGLLLLQPQSDVQVPGKIFEYICIGRPILALVPRDSAVEQVLAKSGVPYVCVYSDDEPEVIDQKVLEFLRLPTRAVPYSDWFRDSFNAEYQAKQLASIIEQGR